MNQLERPLSFVHEHLKVWPVGKLRHFGVAISTEVSVSSASSSSDESKAVPSVSSAGLTDEHSVTVVNITLQL